jgi:predicted alpha/beta-fold hydrolase
LRRASTLRNFDDQVTAYYFGFEGADDYYSRASALPGIEKIAVPALVLHSQDDPFVRILPATHAGLLANPNIHYIETERGGHCGFLAAANGYDGRWAERTVIEFLSHHYMNLQAFDPG